MGPLIRNIFRALRAIPVWRVRRPRVMPPRRDGFISRPVVTPAESSADPYPYVYVESDGTARELHLGEREYLETPYHPADGGRPYVKRGYEARDGWGDLAGFCMRAQLPEGTVVGSAPADNPSKPMSESELVAYLQRKRLRVERPTGGSREG